MAINRFNLTDLSRSDGSSVIAKAAYIAAETLDDPRLGKRFDFTRKKGVSGATTLRADPQDTRSRAEFWAAADALEKRIDSCMARLVDAPIPRELPRERWQELGDGFARALMARYDVAGIDYALHEPRKAKPGHENPHFDMMFPDRDRRGKKLRVLRHNPAEIEAVRQLWQEHVNRALAAAGSDVRIDVRSRERQDAELNELKARLAAAEQEVAALADAALLADFEENFDTDIPQEDTHGQHTRTDTPRLGDARQQAARSGPAQGPADVLRPGRGGVDGHAARNDPARAGSGPAGGRREPRDRAPSDGAARGGDGGAEPRDGGAGGPERPGGGLRGRERILAIAGSRRGARGVARRDRPARPKPKPEPGSPAAIADALVARITALKYTGARHDTDHTDTDTDRARQG